MKNGFYLYTAGHLHHPGLNQAIIDGGDCPDLKVLVQQLAEAFSFPDYFSDNLDSLDEILNDMNWLIESDFTIVIKNYPAFLQAEKPLRKTGLLQLLWDTASQWQHVPNYPGEEAHRDRADFRIYVESCRQIREDLAELDIPVYEEPG